MVCDSGDTYTRVVPVHDGYCLYKSSRTVPFGGETVTKSIKSIVEKATGGHIPTRFAGSVTESFRHYHETEILRDIKHSFSSKPTEDGIE